MSVLSVQLNDYATTWTVWGSMSGREREIFCFCSERPNPVWGPPNPSTMCTVFSFGGGGGRGPEHEVDHSPPLSAEVKN
jgi:hypothetical protein